MKKLFKLATLLFAFASISLTACQDDPDEVVEKNPFENASIDVKLVGADINVATLSLTAEGVYVLGYTLQPAEGTTSTPTATDIFTNGTLITLEKEGATQLTLYDLQPETEYVIYFAGRISSSVVWDQVKEFRFTTAAEPVVPVLEAKLISTEATSAEIEVYAENVSRVAYLVRTPEEVEENGEPSIQVIFATGRVSEVVQGENTITIKSLSPNTEYIAYITGEVAGIEEYMDEIVSVKNIKTSDFADDIAVRDITYRGFTVDVRVDPSVKEENHMIKWATSSLYLYNRNGGSPARDTEIMNLHDTAWGGMNLFNESTSIIIDEEHSLIYNEYGEADNWYYEALVPGQPQVFIAGEYRRGESGLGWGMGYYKPLFDYEQYRVDVASGNMVDETAYWEGFYQHLDVQVKKPEPLPEDYINVEITTDPADAQVKVTAHESLDQVAIMIMSEQEHNTATLWIGEEHMQWFATSIEAMYEGVTMIVDPFNAEHGFNGTIKTALSEYFFEIPRESKFWVYVVGMRGDIEGDGYLDGHEQVYKTYEFYLPQPTKPAPELEVVALESTSPYEVSFNVKCPTKDAYKGKCIANYEKEWLMTGMSAADIVYNYGIDFTTNEIDLINTDNGLTLTYPSRPDATTYLAVMIANNEATETYSEEAFARSLPEPAAEAVDSDLFESLKGEWTATATVTYQLYNNETDEYEPKSSVHTCDITIGAVEYPETMSEEDYATFERHGVNRETATVYYEEFKAAAKTFNDNTRAQNRILMNGFDFAGGYHNYFTYSDPYSLFVSDTYDGLTSEMPLYDFGPKWYLEIAADGTVSAPFNTNYFAPMSSWYAEKNAIYESYFVAYQPDIAYIVGFMGDTDGNIVNGHFPVEVSEDGNTITVKPLVYDGINYYPNAAINYGLGRFSISIAVNSDIVLTRKSAAAATAKAQKQPSGKKVKAQSAQCDQKIEPIARPASRSAIGQKVEFKSIPSPKDYTTKERGKLWIESRKL